jgi:phosphatidylserine decarboxylase
MKKLYKKILVVILFLSLFLFAFVSFFNRTPARNIPMNPNAIVSPAHGNIIHIEKSSDPKLHFFKRDIENTLELYDFPTPYQVIVIQMDPSHVHAQRSPIHGTLAYEEHIPGKFKNALFSSDKHLLAHENEKHFSLFKNEDIQIGVVQVAGIMARRIQHFIPANTQIRKGDIFGRILLGSQVVVVIPDSVEIIVNISDTVIDGESILGYF